MIITPFANVIFPLSFEYLQITVQLFLTKLFSAEAKKSATLSLIVYRRQINWCMMFLKNITKQKEQELKVENKKYVWILKKSRYSS